MATTSDYGSWTLEDLRIEASRRSIAFISKDGIKTLASKLRVHDKLMTQIETDSIEGIEPIGTGEEPVSGISFEQRLRLQENELQMLELRRKIQQEEREAEKEKRAYEREKWEYERQKAREEEERMIREGERITLLRDESEQFAARESERIQSSARRPRFIKVREMRDNEDIDDYFRIFETTAKAQSLPEIEWIGNVVPQVPRLL